MFEERIEVLDIAINVWRSDSDGCPLFILPGFNGQFDLPPYVEMVQAFEKKGFAVYGIEFPGCGKSDFPPRHWTFDNFILLIDAVFEKYNVEKAYVLGHSLGTALALRFARSFPQRVQKLILVSAPSFPIFLWIKIPLLQRINIPLWLFDILFCIFAVILKPIQLILLFFLPEALRPQVFSAFIRRCERTYFFLMSSRGVMRKILRAMIRLETKDDVCAAYTPTLLIWGKRDFWAPPRNYKNFCALKNHTVISIAYAPHEYTGPWAQKLVEIVALWLKKEWA